MNMNAGTSTRRNAIGTAIAAFALVLTAGHPLKGATVPPATDDVQFWLKADTITGLSDGDPVSEWDDSSGNGHDVSAGSAPTYRYNELNGLPTVRFSGNRLDTNTLQLQSDITAFFLIENWPQSSGSSIHKPVLAADNGPYTGTVNGYGFNLNRGDGNFNVELSNQSVSYEAAPTRQFEIIAYRKESGSAALYRNDPSTPEATGTQNDPAGGYHTGYTVGQDPTFGSGRSYSGDMAEMIVYDRALNTGSDSEFEEAFTYLEEKWLSNKGSAPEAKTIVSHWNFDDGSTAADQVGDNDGISFVGGATHSADTPDGGGDHSLDLTNGNDYVTLPAEETYNITEEYTLSAWVKPNSAGGRFLSIMRDLTSAGGSDRSGLALGLDGNNVLNAIITDGSAYNDFSSSGISVPTGQWTQIVATLEDGFVYLYANGEQGTSGPHLLGRGKDVDFVDNDGSFSGFGADGRNGSPDLFYNGLLDEVAVWEDPLSHAEVKAMHTLATASVFNYDTLDIQSLFDVHAGVLESATIADEGHWEFADNLNDIKGTTENGDLFTHGGSDYLLLTSVDNGSGVRFVPIPEPTTFALLALALAGLLGRRRRRR